MRPFAATTTKAAALLALTLASFGSLLPRANTLNRSNTSSTLGSTAAVPKEADLIQAEEAEIGQSQGVRSLDDEIRNHDLLDLGRQDDFYLANNSGKCDVLLDDLIDVALEPRDMLRTQQFVGSITPVELRLYFPERAKDTEKGYKLGKLFARFSLGAVVTPLEIVHSSRDCKLLHM
ncbi:universal stress protein [Babesia caballi]|uniref:Universal stress protein n=1 Tax=Babesia caballi TaxID=5871 RepID=A0AAV4LYM9_BABCB|nr:universal stress protein [Babesia caballi]